ncbi:Phosphatidylinositol N-acetylglucosaminyltransferase gpi3 subunit [Wickerhamiella sorbophila]|uniref:Phosphatidylinositol N-acetylglucosaminyltransferase GPI3 subunit n=1 Tax=Wickerhamiella sorbophila TaxID=45607 RepID=A0A2T0FHB9_9ASCO|nr:Phosphatidylinositol N-acetylglucosaminyltransferase gpi3 subunit [Wickerhamiella sorbophila]PRT54357.1 Phosphatidylinositol N-acetylglucosaminyltransferase gpi3 subunit [Wickerhamiella sorbophila]
MGLNIAMVCDFFYPQPGGVELHIYQVSQQLINRGHSVVIITHAYDQRSGVRTLSNGLKVYYVPFYVIYRESTFPTVFSFFPIFRNIMIREQIDVVHGHGSMSSLCHEAIIHGHTMGLATVFTDHSLFGFADAGSILVNKLLKFTLSDVDHVIAVSHTCRENTVLRATLNPQDVSVIPNAVISEDFVPDPAAADPSFITIIICSRLFANKGADLLLAIIPRICSMHSNVRFKIAGSGPKEVDLQQMIEQHRLQERVELIGGIRHEQVRDLMVTGQIYLHPTLTEAFGTVIVEAASCGLLVVTTKVGGIPEVLPSHMTVYAEPSVQSLVNSTSEAIKAVENNTVDTTTFHDEVRTIYCWSDVAARTEKIYEDILASDRSETLVERMQKHYQCGPFAGKLFVLCVVVDVMLLHLLEWLYPRRSIDLAKKWPIIK